MAPSNGVKVPRTPASTVYEIDLLEVGVADEEVGQAARVGWPGAGQLGRRGRAVRHRIAGIGGQPWRDLIGDAGRRIEVAVAVIAGQIAAVLIVQVDQRSVEPA